MTELLYANEIDYSPLPDFERKYGLPAFHNTPHQTYARKVRFVRILRAELWARDLLIYLAQSCLFYGEWWYEHRQDSDELLCLLGLRELATLPKPGQRRIGEIE